MVCRRNYWAQMSTKSSSATLRNRYYTLSWKSSTMRFLILNICGSETVHVVFYCKSLLKVACVTVETWTFYQ